MVPNPRNLARPIQLKINISEAVRDKLAQAAVKACRSLNGEISARLEASLDLEVETITTSRFKTE